jgi:hypothetical protein
MSSTGQLSRLSPTALPRRTTPGRKGTFDKPLDLV